MFFDLIMVKFLLDYSTRPLQFFGLLGLAGSGSGFLLGLLLVFDKVFYHQNIMTSTGRCCCFRLRCL